MLTGLKELLTQHQEVKGASKSGGKHKQTLREAVAQVLGRKASGRSLLDKLRSIVRAAEGGHLACDDASGVSGQGGDKGKDAKKSGEIEAAKANGKGAHKAPLNKRQGGGKNDNGAKGKGSGGAAVCLRQEDWKGMTLLQSSAVLEALRRGEAPGVKVATLARRE